MIVVLARVTVSMRCIRRDLMSRVRNIESSSTHDSRTQRKPTDSEFTADAERQPRFAAPEPTYCTCTRDRHTSTRRTPACTRTRPYGRRPGASSPGAPSRTSHGHATRPRRPRAAIARATAPSPARTQHIVDTRAKGRRWRRRRPRPPRRRRQVARRPGRGGSRPAAYLRRQGGEAKTICGPTGVRSATQTTHEGMQLEPKAAHDRTALGWRPCQLLLLAAAMPSALHKRSAPAVCSPPPPPLLLPLHHAALLPRLLHPPPFTTEWLPCRPPLLWLPPWPHLLP